MLDQKLTVKYMSTHNCFVHLPSLPSCNYSRVCVVRVLNNENKEYYLSCWNSQASEPDALIINASFAKALSINEGVCLDVSVIFDPPILTSVTVSARNEEDLSIVKLRASTIQLIFLNQISIVARDQPIVIWLSKGLSVTLFVESVAPSFQFGKIEQNTEVHVLDTVRSSRKLLEATKIIAIPTAKLENNDKILLKYRKRKSDIILRVCPMPEALKIPKSTPDSDIKSFFNLYIRLSLAKRYFPDAAGKNYFFCHVNKLKINSESHQAPANEPSSDTLKTLATVIVVENAFSQALEAMENISKIFQTIGNNIIVSEDLKKNLNIHLGDKILLEQAEISLDDSNINLCAPIQHNNLPNTKEKKVLLPTIKNIISTCLSTISMSLNSFSNQNYLQGCDNILICGGVGTGKTTLCQNLSIKLEEPPNFVYTRFIDCKKLKGKKCEVIQKMLRTLVKDCRYYQPSVIFFDDLDSLTNSLGEEENSPEAINAIRIADTLINVITICQSTDWISIVATCASMEKLGSQFSDSRGANLFRTVVDIPNVSAEDRCTFLQSLFDVRVASTREDILWEHYVDKTEGWVVQDLFGLVEKAVFIAWRRQSCLGLSENPLELINEDISQAMCDFNPISLHGIKLYRGSGHSWEDIGGLTAVKQCLMQILQWPLTYPGLYKMAPIRQQSGVLLYGMPGTGKTMLAGAVARECGLNFINVKGPELLSKYIGASEEAVRDIFQRAQRAKPCVVFFDEFESLAPRRGHDSTGVTDRVVNQLLTQFDGVEGRDGVAIVAASSRPDLLDPALLRPGRLDKSLLCPLPEKDEREEILLALCRVNSIDARDLDLKSLADMTAGFTGADLSAVLTQARLNAFEENSTRVGAIDDITQNHLVTSLASTQPSLTVGEINKFLEIYERFSRGDNLTRGGLKHQKLTLA